jgi:toxin ParE1/3/4
MKIKRYNLEISDEAENDFDNSFDYYYNESSQIANAFFQRINTSLEIIRKSPLSFQVIHKDLRKFSVNQFPFVIYFQVVDFTIRILAIFHTSRNPKIWKERLDE